MYLEVKSFFSNKIIKLTLIVSLVLSAFMVYFIFENGDNQDGTIYSLRRQIVSMKEFYDNEVSEIEMNTPKEYRHLKDEMIKSLDWQIENRERALDLFIDGYRKNEEEIQKLGIYLSLYAMSLQTDYNEGYKYATQVFKEDIEEYLDLSDLPFDLYALEDLHNVSWSPINDSETKEDREIIHKEYEENKKTLEMMFFLFVDLQ